MARVWVNLPYMTWHIQQCQCWNDILCSPTRNYVQLKISAISVGQIWLNKGYISFLKKLIFVISNCCTFPVITLSAILSLSSSSPQFVWIVLVSWPNLLVDLLPVESGPQYLLYTCCLVWLHVKVFQSFCTVVSCFVNLCLLFWTVSCLLMSLWTS